MDAKQSVLRVCQGEMWRHRPWCHRSTHSINHRLYHHHHLLLLLLLVLVVVVSPSQTCCMSLSIWPTVAATLQLHQQPADSRYVTWRHPWRHPQQVLPAPPPSRDVSSVHCVANDSRYVCACRGTARCRSLHAWCI